MKHAACALLACSVAVMARAGVSNADCAEPFVFSNARVNVVVLPYRNGNTSSPELERASDQLTLLLQQTILFSALKYPSIGTVRMLSKDSSQVRACEVDVIAEKLLGRSEGARRPLGPDGAAVLLWGQIYQEGDKVYLRSYVRLLQRRELPALSAANGTFVAHLPAEVVAFPARVITTGTLAEIRSAFSKASNLHTEKSLTSGSHPIPMDPAKPFPYQVLQATSDGWMRVLAGQNGPEGWIYVTEALLSGGLAKNLPELRFVDGAIAYLDSLQTKNAWQLPSSSRKSLETFIEAGASPDTAVAAATAGGMLAVMLARDPVTRTKGHQMSRDVVALVPHNADARNLEVVYRLVEGGQRNDPLRTWRSIADDFAQAAALGPDKPYILENLDHFYNQMLASFALPGDAAAEIQRRHDQVTRLRAR